MAAKKGYELLFETHEQLESRKKELQLELEQIQGKRSQVQRDLSDSIVTQAMGKPGGDIRKLRKQVIELDERENDLLDMISSLERSHKTELVKLLPLVEEEYKRIQEDNQKKYEQILERIHQAKAQYLLKVAEIYNLNQKCTDETTRHNLACRLAGDERYKYGQGFRIPFRGSWDDRYAPGIDKEEVQKAAQGNLPEEVKQYAKR